MKPPPWHLQVARLVLALGMAVLGMACRRATAHPRHGAVTAEAGHRVPPARWRAVVPSPPANTYAPSPASVHGDRRLPPDALVAIDQCSVCHADVFAQWSTSAHRYSSLDNPFYQPAFEAARAARGAGITRWCGGCHDPGLLFAGDLDGTPIDRTHERARLGVGCLLCHSVEGLHDRTGNGNYILTADGVTYPRRDNPDAASVARHRARLMAPVTRTSELCGACHKVGIPEAVSASHWLRGQNDFDAWDQSAWAGNGAERYDPGVPQRRCQDCHMPLEPAVRGDVAAHNGMVRSHRFSGGHTALAAWLGDSDTLAREQAMLAGAARIDLFRAVPTGTVGDTSATPLEEAQVQPGSELTLDVVMVNDRVGHRFPGGTADVADTWVELTVHDARGMVLAEHGVTPGADPGPLDDEAHRLEVRPVDDQGAPALMRDPHRYRAVVYDTTLPPRAARIARYVWRVPRGVHGPVTVHARLLHRRLANPYAAFACGQAQQAQGRACPTMPVTVVAEVEATPGGTVRWQPPGDPPPRWRRFYDHGRAISEASVQEQVDEARPDLMTVVALAPARAEGYFELARVAMREGRTDEAYRWLDDVTARDGRSPAVPFLRAQAAGDVWRWADTVAPGQAAFALRPRNVRIAEALANGLGIAGRHQEALQVIDAGLAVDPERAQLHNLQAIELDVLGAPDEAARAREAWLRYRAQDDLPALRAACKRDFPSCARESVPIHVHALRRPGHPVGAVSRGQGPV